MNCLFSDCFYLYPQFGSGLALFSDPIISKNLHFIPSHPDTVFKFIKDLSKLNPRGSIHNFHLKFWVVQITNELNELILIVFNFWVRSYFNVRNLIGLYFCLVFGCICLLLWLLCFLFQPWLSSYLRCCLLLIFFLKNHYLSSRLVNCTQATLYIIMRK